MSNENYIYGVDLSGKITPIQVRDAMVRCFSLAQEELKRYIKENVDVEPEKIERFFVDFVVEKAFKDVGGDFHHPTKESLTQVVTQLREYATRVLRDTDIIEKHAEEIIQLIDRIK